LRTNSVEELVDIDLSLFPCPTGTRVHLFLELANDGGLQLSLNVCLDRALTSWILSFGPFAKVLSPESLKSEIAHDLADAAAIYQR
jgi:predicted DNA-binding transcriptional regulator YafY